MTIGARVFLLVFVASLLIFAWLFRIDAKPIVVGALAEVFVTDRWLGVVHRCQFGPGGYRCTQLYP